MENNLCTLTESEEPNSASQLAHKTKNNKLLQNVGIWNGQPHGPSVLNIETELELEKRANVELRLIVNTHREQMDYLSQQVKETKAARIRDQEEMKKQEVELGAKLDLLLGQGRPG
jgi:hypothetical protein